MKTLEESGLMKISKVNATLPVAQVITTPVYVQQCNGHPEEHVCCGDRGNDDSVDEYDDHDTDNVESNNGGFGLDLESQIKIANRLNHEFTRAHYRRQLLQQQPQMCNNPMFVSYNYNGYLSQKTCFITELRYYVCHFVLSFLGLSVVGSVLNS